MSNISTPSISRRQRILTSSVSKSQRLIPNRLLFPNLKPKRRNKQKYPKLLQTSAPKSNHLPLLIARCVDGQLQKRRYRDQRFARLLIGSML